MLTTVEVYIYASVLFLLPLVVHSLFKGTPPPRETWLGRFYEVEKNLLIAGNLFLLALCATAIAKLALHFGYIDRAFEDRVELLTGMPFMALLVIYLAFWIRAWIKLRRLRSSGT